MTSWQCLLMQQMMFLILDLSWYYAGLLRRSMAQASRYWSSSLAQWGLALSSIRTNSGPMASAHDLTLGSRGWGFNGGTKVHSLDHSRRYVRLFYNVRWFFPLIRLKNLQSGRVRSHFCCKNSHFFVSILSSCYAPVKTWSGLVSEQRQGSIQRQSSLHVPLPIVAWPVCGFLTN